jgi:chaperonin GroES
MSKLVAVGNHVVLKQVEAEETTKSGIILTSGAQEKPQEAVVVAVGAGKKDEPMEVKEGDHVVFAQYAGTKFKLEDEEYIVARQDDILAIIK